MFILKEQKAKVHRASKQIIILVIVALAASILVACNRSGSGAEGGKDNTVAATVNGKNINLSEVDLLLNQQLQGQQAQMSPLALAQARLQILSTLIQKEVLFQRAEKEKLLPSDEEVSQYINNLMQQSRLTQEEFQRRLKEQNQTTESLRAEARKTIAIQKLQDRTNSKIGVPSDKEVEDFYAANKQQFINARGVELADIVVDPNDNGAPDDAKDEAEATSKIQLIYQRLKSGADFATVARERSEDPSNVRGGDIGFATEDDLKQNGFPPELIAQFFGPMQPGDITQPVRFNNRHYIFKLTRKQLQNENLTLDSPGVRDQIKDVLINQRKQILNAALLEVAVNDAKIVNNLATTILNNPNNLSGLRPASAPSQAASPVVNAPTTPQSTGGAAANTSPAPRGTATAGTQASPRP